MRLRARPELRVAAVVAIALASAYTIWSSERQTRLESALTPGAQRLPPLGEVPPAVSLGDLMIVDLRAPSVAARLAPGRAPTEEQERSWSSEDDAAQQQVLTELASHGLPVRPVYSFTRVLDGFSARLVPAAVALLERDPEIAGVYPVQAAFPATVSALPLASGSGPLTAGVGLGRSDGQGVSIALLDTGVDSSVPYLSGHVAPGVDIVGGAHDGAGTAAQTTLEAHGTELAGLLVGSGGPDGLTGVAPGASVLPIRIAGLQADGHGGDALYARSDQLIAGLDRAVDPSGQGDVAQAVRVALIGVAEPYDGFADTPEAQAVAGARALGVLVVAPAGNDGPAGPWYGSLAGPGGSPAALTVGALDSRVESPVEHLVVQQGLDVVLDGTLPLADGTSAAPTGDLPLKIAGPFAGGAALVESGGNPAAAVADAVAAGARAVLLDGRPPATGALGALGVPVLLVDAALAARLRSLVRGGATLDAALGSVEGEPNSSFGALAPFSSQGLSYAGLIDPELSAPGVELASSAPGAGRENFVSVSGTSVAAAVVAGAAALLAGARPNLDAAELASILVGSAHPGGFALSRGGAGVVDVGASAVAEVTASATTLGFGFWTGPRWQQTQSLTLRNVSTRTLALTVHPGSSLLQSIPKTLTLAAGASGTVRVRASSARRAKGSVVTGTLLVSGSAEPLRIPWAVGFGRPAVALLQKPTLTPTVLARGATRPALLRVTLGALPGPGLQIEPVARFELRLISPRGVDLGLIARADDLLPGRYVFALSGLGPTGGALPAGSYTLALAAWPLAGTVPTRTRIALRIG